MNGNREQRIRLLAAVFVTYGLGALVGAVLQAQAPTLVIWLPLISVVVVVVNAFLRYGHDPAQAAPPRSHTCRSARSARL